ncbi:MAG: FkbM family methyltransferase [Magnetococcales bacterium]|nr:FkbM family methyltransferase [Magnetococcales bacterium]
MDASPFKISVHHIGGRAGTRPYPHLNWLEPAVENVLYDADPSCLEQIRQVWNMQCTVLPYCIGKSREEALFHLTYDRYGSSLLTCRPEYDNLYLYSRQFNLDYDPRSHQTAASVPVTLHSLDELFPHTAPPVQAPNFLSLDAEGAEYDILQGAADLLRTSIHGVYTEVQFMRRFVGQHSLQEIDDLLERHGFVLIEIRQTNVLSMEVCRPIGLRDHGTVNSGDVLFLKKPQSILADHPDPFVSLLQAAVTALVFHHFSFALNYLDAFVARGGEAWLDACAEGVPDYVHVMKSIIKTVRNYPRLTPVRFTQLYLTPEDAAARFAAVPSGQGTPLTCASLFDDYLRSLDMTPEQFRLQVNHLLGEHYFGVEEILRLLDMAPLADLIREGRLQQIRGLCSRLRIPIEQTAGSGRA